MRFIIVNVAYANYEFPIINIYLLTASYNIHRLAWSPLCLWDPKLISSLPMYNDYRIQNTYLYCHLSRCAP